MQAKEIKDKINNLSFSHDGKKILFDRCREEVCQIQVYDLATGELSAYQSPPKETWTMARYSYDGRKIIFSVIPMGEEYLDLGNMQIAVMDSDGKNVKKITTGPGAKIYPTFSHSGQKIIYAKAGRIRERGGTPAADFDAWEVDLEKGKEKQLTYYKYFTMNSLSYFPDDERFIFDARLPKAYPGIKDRDKEALKRVYKELWQKKMTIHGIQVMRGDEMIPKIYSFAADVFPKRPLLSQDGTRLFFEGNVGKYYLYSPDGKHRLVGGGGSVNSAAISPDGELLGVIAADISITVSRIKDGSRLEKVYVPSVQNELHYKDILPTLKLLPEQPLRIINQ